MLADSADKQIERGQQASEQKCVCARSCGALVREVGCSLSYDRMAQNPSPAGRQCCSVETFGTATGAEADSHRRIAQNGQGRMNPTSLPRAAVDHEQRQVWHQAHHQPRPQRRLVVQVEVHRLQGQHGEQGHLPHVPRCTAVAPSSIRAPLWNAAHTAGVTCMAAGTAGCSLWTRRRDKPKHHLSETLS